MDDADVFKIGVSNVKRAGALKQERRSFEHGGRHVSVLSSDSFYAGAHVLCLQDYIDPLPDRGALVSVPNRHTILFHPISDARVAFAIRNMIALAHELYTRGPGSASPELYWWRGQDKFVVLPLAQVDGGAQFSPPQEFVDQVLEPLRPKS